MTPYFRISLATLLITQNWLDNFGIQRKNTKMQTIPSLNRKECIWNFWNKIQREKFHEHKNSTPCIILDFTKIGLTNFGNNKNVAPFLNSNSLELGLLVLNVVKGFWQDDNHCQDQWNGYAKHEVEGRWHVSRTIPTTKSNAPHRSPLITKHIGSNPNAT